MCSWLNLWTADVRCAVTLHAQVIGCTYCHATWHVPHSTAPQSTTSARQCSRIGNHMYRGSLLVIEIARPSQTLHYCFKSGIQSTTSRCATCGGGWCVRCAVTLHALASGCTCCHATWYGPHSTALQSTTSARQCSLVGITVTETLFWL